MRDKADGYYDLAIVDPPYGVGMDGNNGSTGKHGGRKAHEIKDWDKRTPDILYFTELFRISENQIIWGANYFPQFLKGSMGWILWDKGQRIKQSDGELAYTSFNKALRIITINRVELLKEGTIHPTQKPVVLYKWLLKNYAKPGDKLLDTHSGSGSFRITAYDMGFDLDSCEIDEDYFKDNNARFENHIKQTDLFKPEERQKNIYSQPGLL